MNVEEYDLPAVPDEHVGDRDLMLELVREVVAA